eukprot:tig00000194_g14814.t1
MACVGSVVQLRGLSSPEQNGKIGLVLPSEDSKLAADCRQRGRIPVILIDGALLCVQAANVRVLESSPRAPAAPAFAIRPVPGKGLGAVATRDIAAGERLLEDPPLIVATGPRDIERGLERLDDRQRAAFFDLRENGWREGRPRTASGTFRTNALPLGAGASTSGLFLQAARFNHSCCANVHHSWNKEKGVEVIHTIRDVREGEELCTDYAASHQTRAARRAFLQQQFGFLCECPACSLEGEALAASDARRAEAARLDEAIPMHAHLGRPEEGAAMADALARLLAEENVLDTQPVARAMYDAYQLLKHSGRHKEARARLQRALAATVVAEGADGGDAAKYRTLLARPLSAPHVILTD